MFARTKSGWMAAAALIWMVGCENTGPTASLTLSVSGGNGAAPTAATAFSRVPVTDAAGNTLDVTRAQVVFREIELERVEGTVDCGAQIMNHDDCEEFEAGPVLFDVPLDGSTQQVVGIDAPAGAYDELEFEIHKVSNDDPEDADFRTAHPDFVGISIQVTGTYNGNAFTYETDLNVEQEFDLMPPLLIEEGVSTNVTVRLDISDWFLDGLGNFLDPATANKGGQNEGIVKENIENSVEAFEDDDRDGEDDDS